MQCIKVFGEDVTRYKRYKYCAVWIRSFYIVLCLHFAGTARLLGRSGGRTSRSRRRDFIYIMLFIRKRVLKILCSCGSYHDQVTSVNQSLLEDGPLLRGLVLRHSLLLHAFRKREATVQDFTQ